MRILHLTSWYSAVGGQEAYLHALCQALGRRGHANTVVYGQQGGAPFSATVASHRIPDIDRPPGPGLEDQWEHLLRLLDLEKPDVVLAHGGANWALLARLQQRLPVLPFVHTFTPVCPGLKFFRTTQSACSRPLGPVCLASAYVRQCASRHPQRLWTAYRNTSSLLDFLRGVRRLLLPSQYMHSVMRQNGLQDHQLAMIGYFTPLLEEPAPPCAADTRLILFVGRLTESKGLQILLHALSLVKPPWRLLVAGAGPYEEQARRLAVRLGLQSAVSFLGWVSRAETVRLYREASIVVVPPLWPEPLGLVGLEAMACARPVVSFATGGIGEWLSDGETGFLVPSGDVRALAAAMDHLLADPTTAAAMGHRGREMAQEKFSAGRHLAALLGELERAITPGAPVA